MAQSSGAFGKLSSLLRATRVTAGEGSSNRGDYAPLNGSSRRQQDSGTGPVYTDNAELDRIENRKLATLEQRFGDSNDLGAYSEGPSGSAYPDDDIATGIDDPTLRRVADTLTWSAFLVAIVELCERFTYYGITGPFQNYISNSYNDPNGLPGAIGLGQTGATALVNFFVFFCYLTPMFGAVVADQYLGKYWAIYYFSIAYAVGILILFLTSLPIAIENGFALGGLIIAMVVMGFGAGGIKSNVSPLIAEQYSNTKPFVRTLKSGERVIVDPGITIQRIYMIFYTCINIGSLSTAATTVMEKNVGFWSAYLLCLLMFLFGLAILVLGKEQYVVRPPKGSVIPHAIKVCWLGLRHGNLNAAKPGHLESKVALSRAPWDSAFVEEVREALTACKVFLFYPIYWIAYSQMLSNFISQAGQMELHGIPNDIMQNIDAITIILFVPIMDAFVYPFFRKLGIQFKPMTRIFMGFMFGAATMAYAAIVQRKIYSTGPCYTAPRACSAALQSDGTYAPNQVHIALQAPAYLLLGLSEIFAIVTGLEYAYTKAPASMKSFIMSIYLLTNSFGSAFGAALSPFAVDPRVSWLYTSLAIVCFIAGLVFWVLFRRLNDSAEDVMAEEQHRSKPPPAGEFLLSAEADEGDGKHGD